MHNMMPHSYGSRRTVCGIDQVVRLTWISPVLAATAAAAAADPVLCRPEHRKPSSGIRRWYDRQEESKKKGKEGRENRGFLEKKRNRLLLARQNYYKSNVTIFVALYFLKSRIFADTLLRCVIFFIMQIPYSHGDGV